MTVDPAAPMSLADGRYVLAETLGAGGMGIVRRARDEVLARDVAVKLLADNLAVDPEARDRFLREARAAAAITHPNVVAVHDVGEEQGRPYLVMELLEAGSLVSRLRRDGTIPALEVTSIAHDALGGLAALHAAGIVHRDVKPANLLVRDDGRIAITDLGVAEARDAPGLTRDGFVMGTAAYLAPERLRGAPASVATDLYALGATLAELLHGQVPTPLADWRPPADAPPGLAALLWSLLSVEPEDRPTDADEAFDILADADTPVPPLRTAVAGSAADRDAPTVPAAAGATGAVTAPPEGTTRALTGAQPTDHGTAAPTAVAAAGPTGPAAERRTSAGPPWWSFLVAAAAVVVVAGLAAWAGDDAGSGPVPAAEEVGEDVGEDGGDRPPVPRHDDPASTARELADWLREQAE
jgi:eukaryotic-like serine/threonine-protein kinase